MLRIVRGPDAGLTTSVDIPVVVGREGDLVLHDPTVSRKHVRFEPEGDGVRVTDLGSAAGVFVNGQATRGTLAVSGDVVAIGGSTVKVLRLLRYDGSVTGPTLTIRHRGRDSTVAIRDGLTLGRDPGCDIHVDDSSVSRRHAVFGVSAGRVVLRDQRTPNGTRVAGRAVGGEAALVDGVDIEVGTSPARITFSEGVGDTGSAPVRVSAEGGGHAQTVAIDAGTQGSVAQVTAELARSLAISDGQLLLYRNDDGVLFHPDDRWCTIGARLGDDYVLGRGDASSFDAAADRRSPTRAGTLNQLPRTVWPESPFVVPRLDPPESTSFRGRGIMWQVAGGLGAVIIGLTLALVNPSYAVFGIITGGIGIISIAASILGEQSRRRHRVNEYRRKVADLDEELRTATDRQIESLRALSPTVDELEQWLAESSPRIWERRPQDADALQPMIGIGRRRTRITEEHRRTTDSPLVVELDAVMHKHGVLERVPVTGPGPHSGSFGVTGPPDRTRSLLARIIVEAAVLHAPNELRIWVAATGSGWEWCRWLPHLEGGEPTSEPVAAAALLARASRALVESGPSTDGLLHLIVVPEMSGRLDVDVIRPGPLGRALWVVGSRDRRELPNGLAVVLDIDERGIGSTIGHYPESSLGEVEVEGIDEERAERLAIRLGRLGGSTQRAAPSGLVELLGLGSATSPDVLGAWRAPDTQRLTVAVGSDDSGAPVTVGFRRDGPHGMIAGTTGSGKSELLQTILVALALRHPPDRLTLFLVDFKGGSTFAPLEALPHVVGLVTDLEHDSSLATRALTALDAEIDRRKRVLEAAQVPDVVAYERSRDEGCDPLPDLLVVIDEFALLVERQPDVRDRLDTIATQGRSLGIHLLLATQSPSGVITHAIRTNTNLWICLRVVTESESMEILGSREAARIPDGSPGRAIIRLGAGHDLRTFQAARIARPVPDEESPVRVTRLGTHGLEPSQERHGARTELDVVVSRIGAAATELGLEPATALWLPPLPLELPAAAVEVADRPTGRLVALVGLADLPRQHSQVPHLIDMSATGHQLVSGVFGSGKTTMLCQIAVDLVHHYPPEDVHIYGIDAGSGSLGPLGSLPHVGDVVGASDVERLTRLLDRLTNAIETRRELLAAAGSGDFLRWRAAGGDAPWIVLLVDDYPAFREVAEHEDMGRLLERFNSLLQNGPAVGVHVVLATTQAVDLRAREINLVPSRLILRSADSADYSLVDGRFAPNEVPALPPGRGLVERAVMVQVCQPDVDHDVVDETADRVLRNPKWARRIARLPTSVDRHQLDAVEGVPIGVGGPEVEPVVISGMPTILLVAGPRQSGRSSTLLGLIESIRPQPDHLLVIAPRPSPLRNVPERPGCTTHARATDVDRALDTFIEEAVAGSLLVIDDAETISSAPGVSARLEQILRDASETGVHVIVSARVNDLPGMFDPWARYLMSLRHVLLLQPTVDDAFLFGAKLPRIPPPMTPGRGLLIERERLTVLQVALESPS